MEISRKSPITILISKNPSISADCHIIPDIIKFSISKYHINATFITTITTNNPVENYDFAFYQNQPIIIILDHYKEDSLNNGVDALFTLKAASSSVFCVYKSKNSNILFQPDYIFIISHRIEVYSIYDHTLLNSKHSVKLLYVTDKFKDQYQYYLYRQNLQQYTSLDFNQEVISTIAHKINPIIKTPYFVNELKHYSYFKLLILIDFQLLLNG